MIGADAAPEIGIAEGGAPYARGRPIESNGGARPRMRCVRLGEVK
eukprot:CAMPEP_0176189934 /NCGR_PEP_ID=MMETSP0121_2-20121125/3683_1 /TAXON_ID=160619 /ORGANISM="Kryptoperidinium foliaceum, Strain CCMP 1326" /LENGTH=44 /DNA_ID= /DNA_START= /DNA_END= /DNA_ORIENTATION=